MTTTALALYYVLGVTAAAIAATYATKKGW